MRKQTDTYTSCRTERSKSEKILWRRLRSPTPSALRLRVARPSALRSARETASVILPSKIVQQLDRMKKKQERASYVILNRIYSTPGDRTQLQSCSVPINKPDVHEYTTTQRPGSFSTLKILAEKCFVEDPGSISVISFLHADRETGTSSCMHTFLKLQKHGKVCLFEP